MTIVELVGQDGWRAQMDAVKRKEKTLKVQKARIKAQQAQQQLHAAEAPEKP